MHKLHVALCMPNALCKLFLVCIGNCKLFFGHVNANHTALLTHQRRAHVAVTPRATAQIQHSEAINAQWEGGSAT